MKVFITGGTGFIGKHVVKKLNGDGHKLLVLAYEKVSGGFPLKPPQRVKFIYGDLSSVSSWKNKVSKFRPEVAIHLAWGNISDTGSEMSIKNLLMSLNLITTLNEVGCKRIIAIGTQWEYGHDKSGKIKENAPREPYNALAAAKIGVELLGEKIALEKQSQFIWLRLFTVYGPGQRQEALIPSVVSSFKRGEAPKIKSIDAKHDFIYVEDVAEAISAVIKKCKAQTAVYNVGTGRLTGVRQMVELISKEYPGSRIAFARNKATKEKSRIVSGLYADISAIRKATGWRPKTSIKAGIKKTIAYYKNL